MMSEARSTSSANVRHGYRVKSLDLAKERSKNTALEVALRAAGIDPDNIAGVTNRSKKVESESPDDESENEDESVKKSKSRGTTVPKHSAGKS